MSEWTDERMQRARLYSKDELFDAALDELDRLRAEVEHNQERLDRVLAGVRGALQKLPENILADLAADCHRQECLCWCGCHTGSVMNAPIPGDSGLTRTEQRKCGGCGAMTWTVADCSLGIPIYCRDCRKKSGQPESAWMSPYPPPPKTPGDPK